MTAIGKIQTIYLDEWIDCYINDGKQRGYVATLDLSKIKYDYAYTKFWGGNDKQQLYALTDGSRAPMTNVFLSLNAFDGKQRRVSSLQQIRNIGIDLDCYKLGIEPAAAIECVKELIYVGKLPNPNVIIRSGNGVQLAYSIAGGLPPTVQMKWLALYITNQLSERLVDLGADFAANTLERVFRLPGTYNVKPGKPKRLVTAEVWRKLEYNLDELLEYCKPLDASKRRVPRSKPKGERIALPLLKTQGNTLRSLNTGRLNDFLKLIELRAGNIELRNVLTYDYAFTLALTNSSEAAVIYATQQINDLLDDPQPIKEVMRTAKNAYKDARKFWTEFAKNDFKQIGLPRDLIKPKKTATLIKQYQITEAEQAEMHVTIAAAVKYDRKIAKRRDNGMSSREQYLAEQQARTSEVEKNVQKLLAEGLKQKQIAIELNLTAARVSQIVKRLKQKS